MKDLIERVLNENQPIAPSPECTWGTFPKYREAVKRHQEALSQLSRMNDIIKTQHRLLERVAALSLHSTGEVGLQARIMVKS